MRGLNPKVSRKYTTVSPNTVLAHSTKQLWTQNSGSCLAVSYVIACVRLSFVSSIAQDRSGPWALAQLTGEHLSEHILVTYAIWPLRLHIIYLYYNYL